MPFTHLVYAGTWYTLAACGMALVWLRFRPAAARRVLSDAAATAAGAGERTGRRR